MGWWVHWPGHGDLGRTPPTSSTRIVSILQILTSVFEIPSCAEEALAWTLREVTAVNVLLVISCPPTSQHVLVRRKTSDHLLVVSHSTHVSARVRSWWLDVCYSYFLHRRQRVWAKCKPLSQWPVCEPHRKISVCLQPWLSFNSRQAVLCG